LRTLIETFRASRDTLVTERVGTGLVRALYSTYVSYLPPEALRLPRADARRRAWGVRGDAEDA
jgi:hypothetical protein